MLKMVNLSSL